MNQGLGFSVLLARLVADSKYTPGQLAQATGIPKETIINWRDGRVQRPRRWQWRLLLKLGAFLRLDAPDATALFAAAGFPAFGELRAEASEEEQAILDGWIGAAQGVPQLPQPFVVMVGEAALARAHAQLSALPRAAVPPPAALPYGSRMPFGRNPLFVGREAELQEIGQLLGGGATVAINQTTIAATGLGGIGKTQLAVEFVHRYGQFFAGGVFWLSFSDPASIAAEVAACGGPGALELRPQWEQLTVQEQVHVVRAAWQSPIPRLLIFDNCESGGLLGRWRPPSGGCRILVTSRRAIWEVNLDVATVTLPVLPRPESIALLRKHRAELPADDAELAQIAAELGDLPLALHLAGNYLGRYRRTVAPAQYLEQLRGAELLAHPSLQEGEMVSTGSSQALGRVFALSFVRLQPTDQIDALALALLAFAARLAPGERVPHMLLQSYAGDNPYVLEDALDRLAKLGLVEPVHDESIRIHRLIAAFVRERVAVPMSQARVEQVMLALARPMNTNGDPPQLRPLYPHLRFLVEAALPRQDMQAAALAMELARFYWHTVALPEAQQYATTALTLYGREPQRYTAEIASCYNLLGLLRIITSDYRGAVELHRLALDLWERIYDADHPTLAIGYNNYGYALMVVNQFEQAWQNIRRALLMRRRLFGLYHPTTAICVHNLGHLELRRGEYRRARRYLRLSLTIKQQVYAGPEVGTAYTLNTLGVVSHFMRHDQTLWYFEEAHRIRQAVVGDMDLFFAINCSSLGSEYHAQGRYTEARAMLERGLAIAPTAQQTLKAHMAELWHQLGRVVRDQGDLDYAAVCLDTSVALKTAVYGAESPNVAATLHECGVLWWRYGDAEQALDYFEQALSLREATLGRHVPPTAESMLKLGELLQAHGDTADAQPYLVAALAVFGRHFGPEHPLTREAAAHLLAQEHAMLLLT